MKRMVQAWPDDWEMPWLTSSNSHVRWTATGRVTGSANGFLDLSDLECFKEEQGTVISASFASLGSTQVLVDVFNASSHVGSVTLPVGNLGTLSTGVVRRVAAQVVDNTLVWTLVGAEISSDQPTARPL